MEKEKLKIIIKKVLEGKASQTEIELLEKFENFFMEKNKTKVFKNKRHKSKIHQIIYRNIKSRMDSSQFTWLRIAASIAIFISVGYVITNWNHHQIIISNNTQHAKQVILPDGSIVELNKDSRITYDDTFNHQQRNVKLKGEAFFKVTKNKKKPFVIKTGDLKTKVVGTQFNIKEMPDDILVTVTEGKVEVYHNQDTIALTINEQAIFNIKTKSLIEKEVKASFFNVWFKETVVLESVKLVELANLIEQLYKVKIVFVSPEVKSTILSLTFEKGESLENIINTINLISEVKLTKNKTNGIIEIDKIRK